MPRGGRRPGAGAPKGNMNAFRSGNYSARGMIVLALLLELPPPEPVNALRAAMNAGFVEIRRGRDPRFPLGFGRFILFTYRYFIDRFPRAQSLTINTPNLDRREMWPRQVRRHRKAIKTRSIKTRPQTRNCETKSLTTND